MEWVGLLENHEDLFQEARRYEKNITGAVGGRRYTWNDDESLAELSDEKRIQEIKERHRKAMEAVRATRPDAPLVEVFGQALDMEDDALPCFHCNWWSVSLRPSGVRSRF